MLYGTQEAKLYSDNPMISNAVELITERYKKEQWNNELCEFGSVLWAKGDSVSLDDIINDGNTSQVNLYPEDIKKKILKDYHTGEKSFCGDWHAHPSTKTIAGQLPSPDDLFSECAVASDFWNIKGSIPYLPISPKFTLILLVKSGGILIIDPVERRGKFNNIDMHNATITRLYNDYSQYHQLVSMHFPAKMKEVSIDAFHKYINDALIEINKRVSERIQIKLIVP